MENTEPFVIVQPTVPKVPIVLSVPHCGISFPEDIKEMYNLELIEKPLDTDWFVHQLYDFAPAMGITMIYAKYSRWVIDLNRDAQNISLYNDGRIITELVPTKTFAGENLYKTVPSQDEIKRRLEKYYWPYHRKIEELLQNLKKEHENVLFYDAHSINQFVPTIRSQAFPDLILGNDDGKTADAALINVALDVLKSESYSVNHNTPFKGGALTRSIGRPQEGIHALQLEMTKVNYMDEEKIVYAFDKAEKMRMLLQKMFTALIDTMGKL